MDSVNDLKFDVTPLHARLAYVRDAEPLVVRLSTTIGEGDLRRMAFLGNAVDDLPPGYAA